jgi:hypothetical protein
VSFVENNALAAAALSEQFNGILSGGFILAWAAVESAFGTSSISQTNNNYFGEQYLTNCGPNGNACKFNTDSKRAAPWSGAVPCSQLGGSSNAGYACFAGPNNLGGSAKAALSAGNGKYLNVAAGMQGASVAQIAQAIADAGWCTNSACVNGQYGKTVQGDYNELQPVWNCLFPDLGL